MAWTPMYLLREDIAFLNDWLNQEEEIAFLISQGHKKWIARKQHDILTDIGTQKFDDGYDFVILDFVEYNLWHISSGPLPLLESNSGGVKLKFNKKDWNDDGKITDPWSGWTEIRTGANSRIPYFGAGHPGIIHLEIKTSDNGEIPMSSFGWIGNHYKIIGNGADQTTEKFWNKLKRMVKKIGIQIPRGNLTEGKKEIYAFPTAFKEIQNGRQCSLNP
ncbi:MAG TPA: hypothetical protein VD905_08230 [Flavobacteriales bacterium]|nr:hypothetical protein [Flavobacteriales bacterium]